MADREAAAERLDGAARPTVSGDRYRDFMSAFPVGVAVVTALDAAGRPQGMTCSSLVSVTVHPPTLLVSLRHGSATLDAVTRQGAFSVNLLHSGARAVAEIFASPVKDRFSRVRWQLSEHGAPWLVDDAFALADCRVATSVDVGDHRIVFGEVAATFVLADSPLVYRLRRFGSWAAPEHPDPGPLLPAAQDLKDRPRAVRVRRGL